MSNSLIKNLRVGTKLLLDNEIEGKIIGYIEYCNLNDNRKTWREYRIKTQDGIVWLSVDEHYNEYSLSYPQEVKDGYMDPIWRKVDEGTQVVTMCEGDVDVEGGDSAHFVEFEDDTEELTYSIETWEDGTEVSKGYYLDPEEIQITEQVELKSDSGSGKGCFGFLLILGLVFLAFYSGIIGIISNILFAAPEMSEYINRSDNYRYLTSITGNEKQKAKVYRSLKATDDKGRSITRITVDDVVKDIIRGIEGDTERVSENAVNGVNNSVSIVTKKEYCLVYYEEGTTDKVLVQISDRKYNYTSDNPPYHAGTSVTKWYRSHYYTSVYTKDAKTWKSTPSAYTMYDGPILHDLGNGYFDVYSSNIKQDSIRRRNSSDGGINRGK